MPQQFNLYKFDKQIQLHLRDVPEEFPGLYNENEITDNAIYSETIS
jgi:hypothetical protein